MNICQIENPKSKISSLPFSLLERGVGGEVSRFALLLLVFSLPHLILAQTLITVKQDGTGDFMTIQDGVDAAANGDTVLVWPGTYFENVNIEDKDIILGSLNLTTNDPAYIRQTIINGNETGSCIAVIYTPDTSLICGFSLTNGSGTYNGDFPGGGAFIRYGQARIQNCHIYNNKVSGSGGGIYIFEAYVYLSGTTIKNNHSYKHGGGISIGKSIVEFDTVQLCNIYNNYAVEGTDIAKGLGDNHLHIVVDTFTVSNPDYYYLHSSFGGIPPSDITWEINKGKIETANQNIFVSPTGNNSNTGLSPDDPVKDIWYALLKLESDSVQPDTIHVLPGVYKMSDGERYPLSLKRHLVIAGQHRDSCILDAEDEIYHLQGVDYYSSHYSINNLTLTKGNGVKNSIGGIGSIGIRFNPYPVFNNLMINNNYSQLMSVSLISSDGVVLSNTIIKDNIGGSGLADSKSLSGEYVEPAVLTNCIIQNNIPDYSMPPEDGYYGRALHTWAQGPDPNPVNMHLYNCLITDNHGRTTPYGANIYGSGLGVEQTGVIAVNCTFGNNTTDSPQGGAIGAVNNAQLSIYNCILYSNEPAGLYMYYGSNELNIYNSLVAGGEEGINVYTPGVINYDPSNIDTDPLWDTTNFYPYSLSAGSPCIDAGTLDLPPGIELPETDLAGNPRVHNGYVDMGAYEYGPWVGIENYNSTLNTQHSTLLEVFPNPFRFETSIAYVRPESGQCIIRIYNLNGRCVKTLMNSQGLSGKGEMKWRGNDDSDNPVPKGTYIVAIILNGKEREAVKLVRR